MNNTDHSPTLGQLAGALAKAQGAMRAAPKRAVALVRYKNKDGSLGPERRREYADFASVVEAIRGPLAANGLSYVQLPLGGGSAIGVSTLLMHESGEWIRSELTLPLGGSDAQAIGSAVSYARRYALMAIVGIAADDQEDDDGGAASNTPTEMQGRREPAASSQAATPAAPATSSQRLSAAAVEQLRLVAHQLRDAGIAGDRKAIGELWSSAESLGMIKGDAGNRLAKVRDDALRACAEAEAHAPRAS